MITDAAVWCRVPQPELWCWLLNRVSSEFAGLWGELRHILSKVLFSTNAEHSRQNVTFKAYFRQDIFQFAQMKGWGHTRSRAPRDVVAVIRSQMLPKRFWHAFWADHLLTKHSGSMLTETVGVTTEDWQMWSIWHELQSCSPLSSILIFHSVDKMASFDHCVILVKGHLDEDGDMIEG